MTHSTKSLWDALASQEPYWSIITDERFLRANLTGDSLRSFFKTGEEYVERLWAACKSVDEHFCPHRSLDFGCGVGRVAIPLARRCNEVVGVDISPAMLAESRFNRDRAGLTNLVLVDCDELALGGLGRFHLVHSLMTFQHIRPKTGLALIRQLMSLAGPDSVVAIQILYHHPQLSGTWTKCMHALRCWVKRTMTKKLIIEMHPYPIATVLQLAQDSGACHVHVELTNHDERRGALLVFKKGTTTTPIA